MQKPYPASPFIYGFFRQRLPNLKGEALSLLGQRVGEGLRFHNPALQFHLAFGRPPVSHDHADTAITKLQKSYKFVVKLNEVSTRGKKPDAVPLPPPQKTHSFAPKHKREGENILDGQRI